MGQGHRGARGGGSSGQGERAKQQHGNGRDPDEAHDHHHSRARPVGRASACRATDPLLSELAEGLRAGRGDEPIAESVRFKVIEVAPSFRGRFRGRLAAERTCIGASAKFCEPCKKCLRHNAFCEKSNTR